MRFRGTRLPARSAAHPVQRTHYVLRLAASRPGWLEVPDRVLPSDGEARAQKTRNYTAYMEHARVRATVRLRAARS